MILVAASWLLSLAGPQPASSDAAANLVLVRFQVSREARYVDDLKPSDIEILEDGQPQKVVLFEGGESTPHTVPADLVVLLDLSSAVLGPDRYGSGPDGFGFAALRDRLLVAARAVRLSVYVFDSRLMRLTPPTRDPVMLRGAFDAIQTAMNEARPSSGKPFRGDDQESDPQPPQPTARLRGEEVTLAESARKDNLALTTRVYEALTATIRDASAGPAAASRTMLLVSDGYSPTERKTEEVAAQAVQYDVPIYPVVTGYWYHGDLFPGPPGTKAERRAFQLWEQAMSMKLELISLGRKTGGRAWVPHTLDVESAGQFLGEIMARIRVEYLAGYYTEPSTGKPRERRVEVRLRSKDTGRLEGGTRVMVR